jgi:hypothetical protein
VHNSLNENKTFYTIPRDDFLSGYNKQQENSTRQKSDISGKMNLRWIDKYMVPL